MLSFEGSTRSGLDDTEVLALNPDQSCPVISLAQVLDSQVDLARLRLARDELLPCFGAFANNVHRIFAVLALAGEGKLVLWLAVWDLVDTEPLVGGAQEAGQVALNILDIVQTGSKRVVDVDDDDLPVGLTLVEKSHDTEDLDLLDFTRLCDELADFADVERVVVTLLLRLGVSDVGVFPGLREGTVVPKVALVGKAVADEAKLALLGVLLDGVELLILGDLCICNSQLLQM